jgi:hypothetical protein
MANNNYVTLQVITKNGTISYIDPEDMMYTEPVPFKDLDENVRIDTQISVGHNPIVGNNERLRTIQLRKLAPTHMWFLQNAKPQQIEMDI